MLRQRRDVLHATGHNGTARSHHGQRRAVGTVPCRWEIEVQKTDYRHYHSGSLRRKVVGLGPGCCSRYRATFYGSSHSNVSSWDFHLCTFYSMTPGTESMSDGNRVPQT